MKSLASSAQDYVGIQVRKADTCILHVQGEGASTNRSYGVAGNVKSGEAFATWINDLDAPYSSIAGTGKNYVGVQIALRGDQLHFQVLGKPVFQGNGKRNYGAVLNLPITDFPELGDFITSTLEEENDEEEDYFDDFDDETDNDECCSHQCCS